ncbi:MAG: OmpH family outer membrane protein [Muribaculaceae bacterium]|jgi:outer membrane protein
MKKIKFTAKMLLAALAFVAASCNDKAAQAPVAAANASEGAVATLTNIRYIDMDSLLSAYTLAQEIAQSNQKLALQYQQQERQKQNELERLGSDIERKRQNSVYMTQESFQSDVDNFNRKQNEAASFLGKQQERIQNEMMIRQRRLNDSINNYIKEYNATRGYDAILLREAGLFFKPELNITAEIIEGLNARYTPAPVEDTKK